MADKSIPPQPTPSRYDDKISTFLNAKRRANIPHPREPNKRIVGWVVDENVAGLSDGLFVIEEIERRLRCPAGNASVAEPLGLYSVYIAWSDEDKAFIAGIPELPGCLAEAPTRIGAIKDLFGAKAEWLEACARVGNPVPGPDKFKPSEFHAQPENTDERWQQGFLAGLERAAQYHEQGARDCRAIAAANLGNELGADCATHAIDHDLAAEEIRRLDTSSSTKQPST